MKVMTHCIGAQAQS